MRQRAQRRRLAAVGAMIVAVAGVGSAALAPTSADGPDGAARRVLAAAKRHLGDAYEWGGSGPKTWDCSGLTSTLWREVGGVDSIPRTSRDQAAWAIPLAKEDAVPGDLVFFDQPVTHVALYLGGGKMLDASSSHGEVIIREVWESGVVSYGRVPRPTAPAVRVVRASRGVQPGRIPSAPQIVEDGRLNAVPPLGFVSRHVPRPVAVRSVDLAKRLVGSKYAAGGKGPTYDAAGFVHGVWHRAGGGVLPPTAAALELRTRRVRVSDVIPGDLVFYGSPAVHVGVYVGDGMMVDASRVLRKVVLRRVFASDTVRFARIVSKAVRATPAKKPATKPAAKPAMKPPRKAPGATKARPRPARPPATKVRPPTLQR
ncbi:MAG: NlpC/P60 family protein [Mycobacteriales bacterium]